MVKEERTACTFPPVHALVFLTSGYHFFAAWFQGYRTGYVYKQPLVKEEPPKPKDDKVELPPAVSSLGYLLEEENFYKDGYVQ